MNPTSFVAIGTREGAIHLVNIGQITMISTEGNGELLIRLSDGGAITIDGNAALELLATLRKYTILTDGRPVSSLELGATIKPN